MFAYWKTMLCKSRSAPGFLGNSSTKQSGQRLIGNVIEQIPGQLAVFGARQLDLDACQVVASTDEPGQVTTEYKTEDGTR